MLTEKYKYMNLNIMYTTHLFICNIFAFILYTDDRHKIFYLILYFTIRIANSVKHPEYIDNLIFNKKF